MTVVDKLTDIVCPVITGLGLELVDLEYLGGIVRVTVDEPGGIGSERLGEATLAVSRVLDERDPLPGRYTLEVSSPGVERALRTPRHFERAVGLKVTMRARTEAATYRRFAGVVLAADDEAVTVRIEPEPPSDEETVERIPYPAIDRARTVFEWGPAPKPGKGSKPGGSKKSAAAKRKPDTPASSTADDAAGATAAGDGPGTTPGRGPGGNR